MTKKVAFIYIYIYISINQWQDLNITVMLVVISMMGLYKTVWKNKIKLNTCNMYEIKLI